MKTISIINQVLGPVMRGPSSSHTAGAFHIGCMARSLLGGMPSKAMLAFDPAGSVFQAEAAGELSLRSVHIRAAARAMAVMHVDGAMGVVCAAPTGGSAGVIPGTLITLAEERSLTREQIALALLAAGAVGVVVAQRATFAAEVAGCQVEIGTSGAMASAAVVDTVSGTVVQALICLRHSRKETK